MRTINGMDRLATEILLHDLIFIDAQLLEYRSAQAITINQGLKPLEEKYNQIKFHTYTRDIKPNKIYPIEYAANHVN